MVSRARRRHRHPLFGQPSAQADLGYWAKLAHWHPSEAAALSLGYSPRFVNPDTVKPYLESSSEAQEFERRLMLVSRAVETGALKHQFSPAEFVAWAKRINLELPDALTAALAKICISHNASNDEVDELREQNALLKLELERFKAATKDPSPRERRSLQSMVAGMASGRYGFNPIADRNSATKTTTAWPLDRQGHRPHPSPPRLSRPRSRTSRHVTRLRNSSGPFRNSHTQLVGPVTTASSHDGAASPCPKIFPRRDSCV
jgi:hypothetical protein